MSVSEEAAAAFGELHNRLKSLEAAVQGSVHCGTSGLSTRLALTEQPVNTSGALTEGRETRRSNIAGSKSCSDIPIFGGEYKEHDDWPYKVRIFLNPECSLLARYLTFLENLDREIALENVQDYGASPDFLSKTANLTWMNLQLFNVLAQNTRGNPFPDGEDHIRGRRVLRCLSLGQIAACLQAQESKQQYRRTQKSLPAWKCGKPQWKEHVKDTGREVEDITMAN